MYVDTTSEALFAFSATMTLAAYSGRARHKLALRRSFYAPLGEQTVQADDIGDKC